MHKLVVIVLFALVITACSSTSSEPTAVPTQPVVTEASSEATPVNTVRQMAFAYWEAFNSYQLDKVLAFLEEGYKSVRESTIKSDIGRLKMFGVKLGMSEKTPPVSTGTDQYEMSLLMKEPTGTRTIRMAFALVNDEWKVTFAEEVKQ